jgi:hypothetical protein
MAARLIASVKVEDALATENEDRFESFGLTATLIVDSTIVVGAATFV